MNLLRVSISFLKNSARMARDRLVLERLAQGIGNGRIDPRAIVKIGKGCDIRLGKNVVICAMVFISVEYDLHSDGAPKPFLEVGDDTYIGEMSNLRAAGGIRIGRKCLIAQGVSIISSNHSTSRDKCMTDQPSRTDRIGVVIEDDVWIGTNVTILPGVTVGRGAIVAAGSVVTSSVTEYDIIAGAPARFLKKRT